MKLIYRREGGLAYFPGLSRPLSIDTERLPPEQGGHIEQLCAAARLLERRAGGRVPPRGAPDTYTYTLTVQQGARRRTLRFQDPIEESAIQALVDYIESLRPTLPTEGDTPGAG